MRLTNAEYSQTVSDLLGEPPDAAVRYHFPEDARAHGFAGLTLANGTEPFVGGTL